MGITGLVVWAAARCGRPSIKGKASPSGADFVVLVGSEGGSTRGFAATRHAALTKAGKCVHVAPMSAFAPGLTRAAQHYIVLAATYGDGDAPASARGFLDLLGRLRVAPSTPVAVLGFGDRSFPRICAYAEAVDTAARTKGWETILPFDTIDRQSPQEFARWGRALGQAFGIPLELDHRRVAPRTTALTLLSRPTTDRTCRLRPRSFALRFRAPGSCVASWGVASLVSKRVT
jgi:sulfite reductase (NADPH) flavoprotein alpha-component